MKLSRGMRVVALLFTLSCFGLLYQNCSSGLSTEAPLSSQNNSSTLSTDTGQPVANGSGNFVNIAYPNEQACNFAVADFIRSKISVGALVASFPRCQIGQGCGISCGKPDGSSCVSANPTAFGVCLSSNEIDQTVEQNMQAFSNQSSFTFAAANSTTCNDSVKNRFREATGRMLSSFSGCTTGGSCESSNSALPGFCRTYPQFSKLDEEFSSSTTPTNTSTTTTLAPTTTTTVPANPQYYNFVGGTLDSCRLLIADFMRTKQAVGVLVLTSPQCAMGKGCGISCGKPGTNCQSANPNSYGACLTDSDLKRYYDANLLAYQQQNGFNFVAGDIATCNQSVSTRHRIAAGTEVAYSECKIGGGCGLSCGKPNGTTCVSANPSNPGTCFTYPEFSNLK